MVVNNVISVTFLKHQIPVQRSFGTFIRLDITHFNLSMSSPPQQSSPVTPQATKKPLFGDCWSCRVLSGGGLLASGGYVGMHAQRFMRQGGPASLGTVVQIMFAAGLAAWGMVVIFEPVGKTTRTA